MISHHPTPELLFDYATGAANEAPALSIACHVAMCSQCCNRVDAMERIGGEILADIDSAALSPDAIDAVLSRLDAPYQVTPVPQVDEATRRTVPSPLWPYIGRSLAGLTWRRVTLALSSARLVLTGARHRVELLRIARGRGVPRHTHRGEELTLVLAGGYTDEFGHFGHGDLAVADQTRNHRPVADPDEDCIALSVLDAQVELTGAFGRLMNPLIRS